MAFHHTFYSWECKWNLSVPLIFKQSNSFLKSNILHLLFQQQYNWFPKRYNVTKYKIWAHIKIGTNHYVPINGAKTVPIVKYKHIALTMYSYCYVLLTFFLVNAWELCKYFSFTRWYTPTIIFGMNIVTSQDIYKLYESYYCIMHHTSNQQFVMSIWKTRNTV